MDKKSILIKKIRWERVWIYFYPESYDKTTNIHLSSMSGEKLFALKACEEEKAYRINISNPGNCKMLPVGCRQMTDQMWR